MALEIALIRTLFVGLQGNELTLGVALFAWLAGGGLGSSLTLGLSERIKRPKQALFFCLLGMIALIPLSFVAGYGGRAIVGNPASSLTDPVSVILVSLIALLPISALNGFIFNLMSSLETLRGGAVSRVYAYESAGAAVGGLLYSFLGAGYLRPFQVGLALSAVIALAALILALKGLKNKGFAVLPLILVGAFALNSNLLENAASGLRWGEIKVTSEINTRYGNLAVSVNEGETTLYEDGSPVFTFPDEVSSEPMAHIPLALHPSPQNVLLIGGGLSSIGAQILKHPIKRLDYCVLDPRMIDMEREFIPAFGNIEKDSRVKIIYSDGRSLLKSAKPNEYDVIIAQLPAPYSMRTNLYFTREFFQEVKAALRDGGVYATRVGEAANYIGDDQAMLLASIYRTSSQVMGKPLVLPLGSYMFLYRKNRALPQGIGWIGERLGARGIEAKYLGAYYLESNLSRERIKWVKSTLEAIPSPMINTDISPKGYYYGLLAWSSRFPGRGAKLVERFMNMGPQVCLALIGIIFIAGGFWVKSRGHKALPVLILAASSWAGVACVVAALNAFEAKAGYVFHIIGFIFTAYMAGLYAGASIAPRIFKRPSTRKAGCLGMALALTALLLALLINILPADRSALEYGAVFAFITVVIACLAGAVFTQAAGILRLQASEEAVPQGGEVGGILNASEHIASSLGALLFAIVLLPALGLIKSLVAVALIVGIMSIIGIVRGKG